jgi:hypothetical protein
MMMPIFYGDESREMWDQINVAKTIPQLRESLFTVCCRLQEFEDKVEELEKEVKLKKRNKASKVRTLRKGWTVEEEE